MDNITSWLESLGYSFDVARSIQTNIGQAVKDDESQNLCQCISDYGNYFSKPHDVNNVCLPNYDEIKMSGISREDDKTKDTKSSKITSSGIISIQKRKVSQPLLKFAIH